MRSAMFSRYFPILIWAPSYDRETFSADMIAAIIVAIMLIPQSLAYALLAGLPPEVGLYASIAPLVIYAVFGTSMTLAVGPVAVASLMTASAIGELTARGTPEYLGAAIVLALVSGLILIAMGLARLGFLANFLSHPVISGFITASALIIAVGQLKHILGFDIEGHNLVEQMSSLVAGLSATNFATLAIGGTAAGFLFWARRAFAPLLVCAGLSKTLAASLSKAAPVLAVIATTLLVYLLDLRTANVSIVGQIPRGLPSPTFPEFDAELWGTLFLPALMIGVVGYVETISVAQTLASKRRERIDPDQELVALGASNIGAAVSGGFPVTGGFSRSVVNFDAGARTPAAGAFTAVGIALATVFLTPLLYFLPKATLAATIIVAVLSLIDLETMKRTWTYSKADFAAMLGTILGTLVFGVEIGIAIGVLSSLALHLKRTSQPHFAIVGKVPNTEHYRNVKRHAVETTPGVLSIRIDESLYFPNARFLEDTINDAVSLDPSIREVVLMCSAVNFIDASALESLGQIDHRLRDAGLRLHLSEVKGPVLDRLQRSDFLENLSGKVFLSQYEADRTLKCLQVRTAQPPESVEAENTLAEARENEGVKLPPR
ncbi:MAG: sulfate permease [Boseongicola sp.]|nr:sulfate permease [Boseongicola sp.]